MDWRALFLGSGSDIWTVIEKAVLIASEDYPEELRIRRDSITEQLYCASTSDFRHIHLRNVGLDASVENTMRVENPMAPSIPELEVRFREEQAGGGSSDERGMALGKDVDDEDGRCTIGRGEEDDADERDEAEMLADEIEKEEKLTDQVWVLRERLKSIDLVYRKAQAICHITCSLVQKLTDHPKTEDEVLTTMEELQEMDISLQILQATKIGQQIMSFKKNPSPEVQQMARALIRKWKEVVNTSWTTGAASAASVGEEAEPVSALALPPMDEGALMDDKDISLIGINQVLEMLDSDSGNSGEHIGGIPEGNGWIGGGERDRPAAKPEQQPPPGGPSEQRQVASTRRDSISVGVTPGAPKLSPYTAAAKETKQGADQARLAKQALAEKTCVTPVRLASREGGHTKEEERAIVKSDKKPPSGRILARDREVVGKADRVEDPRAAQHRLVEATKRMNERYEDIERSKKARTVQVLEVTVVPGNKAKTNLGGHTSTPSKASLIKKMQKLKAGKGR